MVNRAKRTRTGIPPSTPTDVSIVRNPQPGLKTGPLAKNPKSSGYRITKGRFSNAVVD
ncbi:hypothetical protein PHLCEN_2v8216 [Hermanssonia centrifuga]|uniref:Uncharacterized protein n=1 Tax=Hermanssonia centrifuga TaxID=98765 RepID=A0A2R6NUA1_9APHY|nr:hypothetical protein PHLCEN_2v8216 [Hermanssonia centrifuga]